MIFASDMCDDAIPSLSTMRMCEREGLELPPERRERNENILRRLAKKPSGEELLTYAHREGKLTAIRLRPASKFDQNILSVSSTTLKD